ncbi:MAG: hypothetical protein FJW35_01755 [Acidobacteria bacterium]|nr:hypothetical protein [Acidobacteriota bacterium]
MSDNQSPKADTDDARAFYRNALRLAQSRSDADHDSLHRMFSDPMFYSRLDSEEAYRGDPERLRVAGVLQKLAENGSPGARKTLAALARSGLFAGHRSRILLLIRALANVKPATPDAVAFWARHCQPEDGYSNVTIRSVIENGSAAAVKIFEMNIVNSGHPEADRYSWLVMDVLQHRNDLELLRSCERLIDSPLEESYRLLLVEVLFDYQPEKWYRAHGWVEPPPRSSASDASLGQLRAVGRKALGTLPLSPAQRNQVQSVIDEINRKIGEK